MSVSADSILHLWDTMDQLDEHFARGGRLGPMQAVVKSLTLQVANLLTAIGENPNFWTDREARETFNRKRTDLALERQLLVVRSGQLQTAQHSALALLPPRLVTRPQHADGEAAVRVEVSAEVALDGRRALFLADLLDARG